MMMIHSAHWVQNQWWLAKIILDIFSRKYLIEKALNIYQIITQFVDEPFGPLLLNVILCSTQVAEKLLLWSRDHKLINRIETVDTKPTQTQM